MAWQYTPYVVPLVLAATVACAIAAWTGLHLRRPDRPRGLVAFLVVELATATWAAAYAGRLARTDPTGRTFFGVLVVVGAATLVVAWPVFVLTYTGRRRWVSLPGKAALAAVPAAGLLASLLDPDLAMLVLAPSIDGAEVETLLTSVPGAVLLLFLVYAYVVTIITAGWIVRWAQSTRGALRLQALALLFAGTVPLVGRGLVVVYPAFGSGVDPTPILFGATTPVVALALFRYDLFDVVPIAHRQIVDQIRDGVFVLDARKRVVDANPVAASALGADRSSLLGAPAADVFADYEPVLTAIADADADANPEIRLDGPSGVRWYDVTISRLVGDRDRTEGYAVVFRDVTDQKHVERKFRTLIERTSNLITILDERGEFTYVSPSADEVLGYEPEALLGTKAFDLVHPDDRESVRAAFGEAKRSQRSVQVEYRVRHADGSWRTLQSIGDDLYDDPVIDGMVVDSRDVTDRRHFEQRLEVLNRVLRHDLRNDVNIVLGHADLLGDRLEDEAALSSLDTIRERSMDLVDLSKQARLIDYAFHREKQSGRVLDVADYLDRRLAVLGRQHPEVVIDADLPDSAWVEADALIDSALDNVVENAIEHCDHATPHLTITVRPHRSADVEYVEVVVADDGPGIPPKEREVLERRTETQLEHASGLGLWLVSWLVENSDGDLEIEDNEPRGSVVKIRLLRAEEPDRAADEPTRHWSVDSAGGTAGGGVGGVRDGDDAGDGESDGGDASGGGSEGDGSESDAGGDESDPTGGSDASGVEH